MAVATSYIVENDRSFQRGLDRLQATTSDFRIPFGSIGKAWLQSNKQIFTLKSSGKYADPKPSTVRSKLRNPGFVFPLLIKSGRLSKSLLSKSDKENVLEIGRASLVMGTTTPHAIFHQEGTKFMPARKPIFISGGPKEDAKDASAGGRLNRWLNIINDHILQLLGAPLA